MITGIRKATALFGISFLMLGVTGYLATERRHWSALIPAMFGLLLLGLWRLQQSSSTGRAATWATRATGISAFLGVIPIGLAAVRRLVSGESLERLVLVTLVFQVAMVALALAFSVVCVGSLFRGVKTRQTSI